MRLLLFPGSRVEGSRLFAIFRGCLTSLDNEIRFTPVGCEELFCQDMGMMKTCLKKRNEVGVETIMDCYGCNLCRHLHMAAEDGREVGHFFVQDIGAAGCNADDTAAIFGQAVLAFQEGDQGRVKFCMNGRCYASL